MSFDWPKGEGEMFRVLMEQVRQVQPTVVVLGYGMASSFDGDVGLEKFKTDYNKLIDAILELNKETVQELTEEEAQAAFDEMKPVLAGLLELIPPADDPEAETAFPVVARALEDFVRRFPRLDREGG